MAEESIDTKIALILQEMQSINEKIGDINKKFDSIANEYTKKLETDAIKQRVSDIEANIRWIVRTFIGSVIVALITMFFAFKK